MVQLKNICDIEKLEIKSLDEVINESSKPWRYDGWKEIEKQLIESRKAPSLSTWLLYEHQFKKRTVLDISKAIKKGRGSVGNIFNKMGIPKRNPQETAELRTYERPSKEESYLLLGDEKKFDAGLDETIARMYPDWLCDRCRNAIKFDEKYG